MECLGDARVRTSPTWEPVALADLKTHMRITTTDEDTFLTGLIVVARMLAERYTRLTIPQTAWSVWHNRWPLGGNEWWDGVREGALSAERRPYVELPQPPLQAVTAFKVYDDADTPTTVDPSTYFVSLGSEIKRGRLNLRNNASWPIALRCADAVEIQFTSGWLGTDATNNTVPAALKTAIKMIAAWLYSNRGDCEDSTVLDESGAGVLLKAYKVPLL